jgi:hypothetical protein
MENPRRFPLIDLFCILALLVAAGTLRAADDIPKRPAFDRYAAMIKKSPFAVATANALPAATPNFAKDLYIANAAQTQDGGFVTIQSSIDRNLKEYLTTSGPNEHGYSISNFDWSEKQGQTKVTISKDGQFATLAFNQALMGPTGGPNMPQPSGVSTVPGQPPVPVPAYMPPKPPNASGMPTPPPHTRGLIQRNPTTAAQKPNNATVDQ